jgi:small conductance mechanosensitive channel
VRKLAIRAARVAKLDDSIADLLGTLAWALTMATTVLTSLEHVGLHTTSLLALLGSASLAIGLALQGNLAHLASGVLLLVTRPFVVGDYVEIGGKEGRVSLVSVLNTTIISPDNETHIFPNGAVLGNRITNFTTRGSRRIHLALSVNVGDLDALVDELENAIKRSGLILKDPEPAIVFVKTTGTAIEVKVSVYCKPADVERCQHELAGLVHASLRPHLLG